jgi:hypothetical protein
LANIYTYSGLQKYIIFKLAFEKEECKDYAIVGYKKKPPERDQYMTNSVPVTSFCHMILVTVHELINPSCCVNKLHFTCIERMRCI